MFPLRRAGEAGIDIPGPPHRRFSLTLPAMTDSFQLQRRRLLQAIGDTAPYFYPFKRILFWGTKP